MSTRTRTQVEVTTETAVNWVNNELMSGFISIGRSANADIGWLVDNRERLTDAFSTWLEEQSLAKIKLEIRTRDETVLETYVFDVSYDGDMGYVEFPVQEVKSTVTRYDRDVYIYLNPVTYNDRRSRDFGYAFSEADDLKVRNLTSFGAGHISVNVGKVIGTNSGPEVGSTLLGLAAFFVLSASLAVLWVLGVAVMGAVMEILSWVLPAVIADVIEVAGLATMGLIAIGFYTENLRGQRLFVIILLAPFVWISWLVFPLRYISPFGLVELPMLVVVGVCLFIGLDELTT